MKLTLAKLTQCFWLVDPENPRATTSPLAKLAIDFSLPITKRYWIGRLVDAATTEFKAFLKECDDLIRKHGTEVGPDKWEVKGEALIPYSSDYEKLLAIEVDLPELNISLGEIGNDSTLTGLDFNVLDWLIVADEASVKVTAKTSELTDRKNKKAARG